MLKLVYYVPESHLDITKEAVFNAGAGQDPCYQNCAWQVKGIGQFRPVDKANPFLGKINQLEKLDEWRVEVIVDEAVAKQVKSALINSHPYEQVAFEFYQILEI